MQCSGWLFNYLLRRTWTLKQACRKVRAHADDSKHLRRQEVDLSIELEWGGKGEWGDWPREKPKNMNFSERWRKTLCQNQTNQNTPFVSDVLGLLLSDPNRRCPHLLVHRIFLVSAWILTQAFSNHPICLNFSLALLTYLKSPFCLSSWALIFHLP